MSTTVANLLDLPGHLLAKIAALVGPIIFILPKGLLESWRKASAVRHQVRAIMLFVERMSFNRRELRGELFGIISDVSDPALRKAIVEQLVELFKDAPRRSHDVYTALVLAAVKDANTSCLKKVIELHSMTGAIYAWSMELSRDTIEMDAISEILRNAYPNP